MVSCGSCWIPHWNGESWFLLDSALEWWVVILVGYKLECWVVVIGYHTGMVSFGSCWIPHWNGQFISCWLSHGNGESWFLLNLAMN
jgi:hypothetical protein